jgi:phosphate transport system permease protein
LLWNSRVARAQEVSRLWERLVETGLLGCALLSLAITPAIVLLLGWETLVFLREVPLRALFLDGQWTPLFTRQHFGLWPLIAGTVLTTGIGLALAVPLGVLAALYCAELAPPALRRYLRPLLELLSGIPTIVYGYFALVWVTPVLQRVVPGLAGFNALGAGVALGIMLIPMICALSAAALRAVPSGLREGALALGASRPATILRVVLPAASAGIVASVLWAASRAVGETMIVAIAAGQEARLTLDPRVPVQTLTAFVAQVSGGDSLGRDLAQSTPFVVGALLFAITFPMNALSLRLERRFRRRS